MTNRKFAVIGHPIEHSMSPFLNERLFDLYGAPAAYETMDIAPGALAGALPKLRLLDGFNVTIPHKQAIIPLLDVLDAKAAFFGSVNTVKKENGRLVGYTTDGAGFRYALERAGVALAGHIMVLGCGGVSRVMAYEAATVCAEPDITLVTRENSLWKAEALRDDLEKDLRIRGKKGRLKITTFDRLEQGRWAANGLREDGYDLLVNGTSAGMYPRSDDAPVSETVVRHCKAVFDAVYNPHNTRLLQIAGQYGIPAVHGMDMLVGQAAASHKIWDGASYENGALVQLGKDALTRMEQLFGQKNGASQ